MQVRGVRGVDTDFERLQPVAGPVTLEREDVAFGRDETVEFRKGRRFAFTHISPEDGALLPHRISALPDALAQLRLLRLCRRLQALPGRIEQPAMEGAA